METKPETLNFNSIDLKIYEFNGIIRKLETVKYIDYRKF